MSAPRLFLHSNFTPRRGVRPVDLDASFKTAIEDAVRAGAPCIRAFATRPNLAPGASVAWVRAGYADALPASIASNSAAAQGLVVVALEDGAAVGWGSEMPPMEGLDERGIYALCTGIGTAPLAGPRKDDAETGSAFAALVRRARWMHESLVAEGLGTAWDELEAGPALAGRSSLARRPKEPSKGGRPVEEREISAANPRSPAEVLRWRAVDEAWTVRLAAMGNPAAPPEAVECGIEDWSEPSVVQAAARHPNLPASAVLRAADATDARLRRAVAFNPNLPPVLVLRLCADADPTVRDSAWARAAGLSALEALDALRTVSEPVGDGAAMETMTAIVERLCAERAQERS